MKRLKSVSISTIVAGLLALMATIAVLASKVAATRLPFGKPLFGVLAAVNHGDRSSGHTTGAAFFYPGWNPQTRGKVIFGGIVGQGLDRPRTGLYFRFGSLKGVGHFRSTSAAGAVSTASLWWLVVPFALPFAAFAGGDLWRWWQRRSAWKHPHRRGFEVADAVSAGTAAVATLPCRSSASRRSYNLDFEGIIFVGVYVLTGALILAFLYLSSHQK